MAGQVIWKGPTNALIELRDSGVVTLADRCLRTVKYAGPYSLCLNALLARGTFGSGSNLGWVVTSCKAEPHSDGKGIGILTINWEAGGASAQMALPCDEFDVQPAELYPRVERNAFFNSPTEISLVSVTDAYGAIYGATPDARKESSDKIAAYTDATQKALAQKLVEKLKKGLETFYISGFRYSWTFYTYTVPSIHTGGVIENPGGPLQGRFYNLSFLRLADAMVPAGVNGSMFKVTRTWLGGPLGHWDPDLYAS